MWDSKTILRPLVYEWPNDPNVLDCADEYLLGEDILVAPLLKEKAERRSIYQAVHGMVFLMGLNIRENKP